jgi:preprotein translocase subunit YajC
MEPIFVAAVPLVLLWALFIYPQQKRVRAHQQLVASLAEGDEVVLSAGIHGRIVELGADELRLEVAPGVTIRVARQAVLRRAEATTSDATAVPGEVAGATVEDSADEGGQQ